MIVPIRLYGDQCLQEIAFDAELEEGDNVFELVQDLFETLDGSGSGVGLAATQIGVPLRVFVAKHKDFRSEFINPVIITGVEALGRGHDLQKLDMFLAGAAQVVGPEAVAQYVNVGEYFKRRATSLGIKTDGLVKTDEQMAQEAQQA